VQFGGLMAGYGLIVVDMIKDNVNTQRHGLLDQEATKIIPNILLLTRTFRRYGEKVIFACDSFMEDDFIFGGRMRPHAIRGTGGDQPIDELEMQSSDLFLAKRRMSSFHKTDLDQTLRTWKIHTVVVCGIVTNVCVLLTVMDAIQNDFRAVMVSDACACHKPEIHEMTLQSYSNLILFPLIRVLTASEIANEIAEQQRH
jgi:nicotinamidase/pyrazinamidase